ncbi:hypothetical protein ACFOG5_13295 [Pedobacter fastidiosus]|uniref:Baseplate J-like protein n=1 Tax=Pedobacter fastidiosus TaxID=2765361 RepID=A0ABR7KLP4_9SPHI|nr:hypothetical protein [Pedobacter fastidiosus]MBC6108992.1 hypothetical protein [Pedobacter fastidiosus]
MEPTTLCILTFPQSYKNGRLTFNIVIIPRNLNPLLPLKDGLAAFADAQLQFKSMVINSLDGLPLTGSISSNPVITLENPVVSTRNTWEALKKQMELSDGMKIDDIETKKDAQRAGADVNRYKERSIRKYLPESYRSAFNFVRAKTKYALSGDEYSCAVKNKNNDNTDRNTQRNTLSWGKVVAFCLRNPALAEKVGLIYKASIELNPDEKLFEQGGWLYTELASGSDFDSTAKMKYAARIPALKGLTERVLFSAVQFPVADAIDNLGYDEILRDAMVYDDGFAKIVHSNQPINQDLLQEKDNSNPPLKDIGIRLGWDDEQIAIWYNRQMLQKEEQSGATIDAPLGVFGYRLDVRKLGEDKWLSQNSLVVQQTTALDGGAIPISVVGDILEPGTEVHPAAHGDSEGEGFWLPMYFSSWAGKAVSIADKDAEDINMLTADQMIAPRPEIQNSINNIPKRVAHPYLANPEYVLPLVYGEDYEFRVRLMDISGGGPKAEDKALNGGERPIAHQHFKRYIAAGAMNIVTMKDRYNALPTGSVLKDTSILQNILDENNPILKIKRPLLGYPAVVFTGKYSNAVDQLKAILGNLTGDQVGVDIGLADPDVEFFKIRVEVKGLEMDNGRSENGREPYFLLFEKEFQIDKAENDYDQEFVLRIVHQDINVIDLTSGFGSGGAKNELVLPTSRHLRLTFIPLIKNTDNDYADSGIAEGKKLVMTSYQPSLNEVGLLSKIDTGYKAIYLQPEHPVDQHKVKGFGNILELNFINSSTPIELSRLADAFNLVAHNLTLEGEKGTRVQFGCSNLMRHSLAPDASSLTFSSLGELFNHWIIGVDFTLLRDWSWDGLKRQSITISRGWKANRGGKIGDVIEIGTINVSDTASMNSLQDADRQYSRLIFMDAFDPKQTFDDFPSGAVLTYFIKVNFEEGVNGETGSDAWNGIIELPVTIIPKQIPKLISAGIALSPYIADAEKYASTEFRQRFLWLEMDREPDDEKDTYFARVLSNAPDPLLCSINEKLLKYDPVDPELNINDEKIRIILAGGHDDNAGMGAMQQMIRGEDESGKSSFYMLPLPPGLHADSDELFGFFSYEIRLGHKKGFWTTAQGRYGRPLRANGVQHPAPALTCTVIRRKTGLLARKANGLRVENNLENVLRRAPRRGGLELEETILTRAVRNEIVITAPFATAVLNGENVSANPPQTSMWYMLYTQVRQADGKSYRNLLIDSGNMPYAPPKRKILDQAVSLQPIQEGTKSGRAILKVEDIQARLLEMGLPAESSLSVLCVEMFPLDNQWSIDLRRQRLENIAGERGEEAELLNPLTTGLGSYRIYRTSALVAVSDVCCDDC